MLFCTRYVEGLAEIVVRSGSDIARLQDQGNKVRRMAATDMNEHSSRYIVCVRACVRACMCVREHIHAYACAYMCVCK